MAAHKTRPVVLGIGFSPRKGGNSDIVLQWALQGARKAGAKTKKIFVRDFQVNPCKNCSSCEDTGECEQKDDFSVFSSAMDKADIVVISSPVYFLNVPAQAKALIDRFQIYWLRKYCLHQRPPRENRPAMIIMVAGSDGKKIFEGTRATVSSFLYTAGFKTRVVHKVGGVDEKGEVRKLKGLRKKIESAGKRLPRLAS